MPKRSNKAESILDVAERMARTGGYNGYSFREIAKEVGIKAASVHYHYPSKEELGVAIARRYTDRFLAAIGAADDESKDAQPLLTGYVAAYRHAIRDDDLMCLCGVLGAEISYLPELVAEEARRFFDLNIQWVTAVYERMGADKDSARSNALRLISLLEGALILSRTLGDKEAFEAIVADAV